MRMRAWARSAMLTLAVTALSVGAAFADRVTLTAAQARTEIIGADLHGYFTPGNEPWHECIERSGRTFYEVGRSRLEGRVRVLPSGLVCFRYADTDFKVENCFMMTRDGDRVAYQDANGEFVITARQPGVANCNNNVPVSAIAGGPDAG